MVDKRKANEEQLDSQLKEWSTQLAQLSEQKQAQPRTNTELKSKQYSPKRHTGRTKRREYKTAGDEVWEDLKTGAEKEGLAEAKIAIHDATLKLSRIMPLDSEEVP